ncbi:hypothetical protein [Alloactinosynnema sp. L-07]|uniref:hypothetical protein n=1 Tax=Alloactinosynnema sp. L-07 TaxID=1653480 RepID=UPI0006B4C6F3|nr:hypothetical protein [Alloactinosynnema sp. L-07]
MATLVGAAYVAAELSGGGGAGGTVDGASTPVAGVYGVTVGSTTPVPRPLDGTGTDLAAPDRPSVPPTAGRTEHAASAAASTAAPVRTDRRGIIGRADRSW